MAFFCSTHRRSVRPEWYTSAGGYPVPMQSQLLAQARQTRATKKARPSLAFLGNASLITRRSATSSASLDFRTVDQLDERHRRVVADAEAQLQDAQVAARCGS